MSALATAAATAGDHADYWNAIVTVSVLILGSAAVMYSITIRPAKRLLKVLSRKAERASGEPARAEALERIAKIEKELKTASRFATAAGAFPLSSIGVALFFLGTSRDDEVMRWVCGIAVLGSAVVFGGAHLGAADVGAEYEAELHQLDDEGGTPLSAPSPEPVACEGGPGAVHVLAVNHGDGATVVVENVHVAGRLDTDPLATGGAGDERGRSLS